MECQHAQPLIRNQDWAKTTMDNVRGEHLEMSAILRGVLGTRYAVDEMALLFAEEATLSSFVRAAVSLGEGYTLFNTAYDTVKTSPILSEYHVRYWFLSTPHGFRVELMATYPGSPLHDQIQLGMSRDSVYSVHASFKCEDEEAYGNAVHSLKKNAYQLVQSCESSYGRFSYWQPLEAEERPHWFLKPRVNLRDAA